ncbi:DUF5819 family protein [Streptomyces orinoci]|uniref:DUF5819 family protein n=1 Tax=Streptomyces orinoci TaxID=67339 RepID=A0ABV3K2G0_STRON|nr:DUF5819 family protein [Streptomyces orinoci]
MAGGGALVALATAVHLVMVFFHVAPPNTVSRQHARAISQYVLPEYEQNWKLFAPNPLQQNISVQVRPKLRGPDGRVITGDWIDLSAQDGAAIRHNPFPSHTQQNQLRRAWDFYSNSHDQQEHPLGLRGRLSEAYLRRLVIARIGTMRDGRTVDQVQLRLVSTPVGPPPFSGQHSDTTPSYRELAWWLITAEDLPGDR